MTGTSTIAVSAQIALSSDAGTLAIGEPFWLDIEARHPPGRIAILPQSIDLGASLGERTSARTHERATREGDEIDHYRLELIAFESGELKVPSIPIAVGSTTARTRELLVSVRSGFSEDELKVASSTLPQAIPELESLAAQDPAPESITGPDYTLIWVLSIAAIAVLAALIARSLIRRKRERASAEPPPPPPRPAHEVALERLEQLEAEGHPKDDALKEFYTRISETLREYAGGRYGFDSLELTVDELMDALDAKQTEGLERGRLRNLLVQADLVKFAKYRPTKDEAIEIFGVARGIVDATKPKENA